jgi:hypothetical protein
MDPVLSQNSINIILPAEGTLLNSYIFSNDVFPLYAPMFAQVHYGASTFHQL